MRKATPTNRRALAKASAALAFSLERCEELREKGRAARSGSALEELASPAHDFAEALREAIDAVEAGDLAAALFIVADRLASLTAKMDSTAAGMLAKDGGRRGGAPRRRPSAEALKRIETGARRHYARGGCTWLGALRRSCGDLGLTESNPASLARLLPLRRTNR